MLIDSHCHLNMIDLGPFEGSLQNVLLQANNQGVHGFLLVAVTLNDYSVLVEIADKNPNIALSVGLHPNEDPEQPLDIEQLKRQANHPKVVAIGETGLDYFRSTGTLEWQRERFAQHIDCAKELRKPLIVHTREAQKDTIDVLRQQNAQDIGGVMHCFTEDWEMAKKALDLNFYISFSGIVTFKSATTIQEVARLVPLDKMLIETDSPYLAPMPHRGKPNVPAYVTHVAEYIAALRGESVEKIAQATTSNFFRLFNPLFTL